MAAAAVTRASHRATRVMAAPAVALTSLPHEIRDSMLRGREKHVHSKEGSTGHLYNCPCDCASV